jgi:hypothetical protein
MHLRNQLGDQDDGKKVWCELRLKTFDNQEENYAQVAVDMGIVTIDEKMEDHLKNRITEVHALIEIKYVQISANAKKQFKDNVLNNISE